MEVRACRKYFFPVKELLRAWEFLPTEERNDSLDTRLGQTLLRSVLMAGFGEFTRAACDALDEMFKSQCRRDLIGDGAAAKAARKAVYLAALTPRGDVSRIETAKDVLFFCLLSPYLGRVGEVASKLLDAALSDVADDDVRDQQKQNFRRALDWVPDERALVKETIEMRGMVAHGRVIRLEVDAVRTRCAVLEKIASEFVRNLADASAACILGRTVPMRIGKRSFVKL